ncbi:MAG: hypothetical protein LBW85_08425 [Deltaproteobacteria bacterium]|jgi:hypothetical protein|nr:hypothetical protein [Deltaproteobacteria bacterium]
MTKIKNDIEDEIDAIRINLYEKTKHMTYEEMSKYISDEVTPIYEKYGIKPISSIDEFILSKLSK